MAIAAPWQGSVLSPGQACHRFSANLCTQAVCAPVLLHGRNMEDTHMETEDKAAESVHMPTPPKIKVNRQLASVKAQVSPRFALSRGTLFRSGGAFRLLGILATKRNEAGYGPARVAGVCCTAAWPVQNWSCSPSSLVSAFTKTASRLSTYATDRICPVSHRKRPAGAHLKPGIHATC